MVPVLLNLAHTFYESVQSRLRHIEKCEQLDKRMKKKERKRQNFTKNATSTL